jgi:hypothetical protein
LLAGDRTPVPPLLTVLLRRSRAEREQLQRKLEDANRAIVQSQHDPGVRSLHTNDNGNSALVRAQALNEALTAAEITSIQLRAQQKALKVACCRIRNRRRRTSILSSSRRATSPAPISPPASIPSRSSGCPAASAGSSTASV